MKVRAALVRKSERFFKDRKMLTKELYKKDNRDEQREERGQIILVFPATMQSKCHQQTSDTTTTLS